MLHDPSFCDCKLDYSEEEITGEWIKCHYHGQGIWQCPECLNLYDYSEVVYSVRMKYFKDEDGELQVTPIKLDERLTMPVDEGKKSSGDAFMEDFIEGGSWDYEGIQGHPEGIFDIEMWWHWDKFWTDCGWEYDLEMIIISEKEVK